MKSLKYILLLPVLVFFGGLLATSCGDNTDFFSPHYYTDEEMAQMRYNDSIDSINRTRINADLVLIYDIDNYPSQNYSARPLAINLDSIAEFFGITTDDLINGIRGEEGAIELTKFCIANTTRADYLKATTTNGPWGHWYDPNGDPGEWGVLGDNRGFFCEWREDNQFDVAAEPAKSVIGANFQAIEALMYEGKRVAVVIRLHIVERPAIEGGIVWEESYDFSMPKTPGYATSPMGFDVNAVMDALGVSDLGPNSVDIISTNADGSYWQENTADPRGFYYDAEGHPGYWADGSFFICYNGWLNDEATADDQWQLQIGQKDPGCDAGFHAEPTFGFMTKDGSKIAMIHIIYDVTDMEDNEEVPAGDPQDATVDIKLEKPWTDDYAVVSYDLKETLRNAFKMTTTQMYNALGNDEFFMYNKEITDGKPEYTANAPGYWMDAEGNAKNYGDGTAVFAELNINAVDGTIMLNCGNYPDQALCPPGTTVNTTFYIVCNGATVTANLSFAVKEAAAIQDLETAPAGNPADMTFDVVVEKPWTDDYAAVTADLHDQLMECFKMTTAQMFEASRTAGSDGLAGLRMYCKEVTAEAPAYTGGGVAGYWLALDGSPAGWGDGSAVFAELYLDYETPAITLNCGNFPDQELCPAGSEVKTTLYILCNGVTATINLTIKVGAAAE